MGNSASGIDISREISTISQLPLLVSEKSPSIAIPNGFQNPATELLSIISSFDVKDRTVHFSCGRTETCVDSVLFCTGYMYSYPFLRNLSPLPAVCSSGVRVENLYYQMIYHPSPTLFFTGLPQRVVPFPVSEAQSAVIARLLSGRLQLPAAGVMQAWEQESLVWKGSNKRFHDLKFPLDADYINSLSKWATSAPRNKVLENDGVGKMPPFWGEEKRWLRSIMPQVKDSSKRLGDNRFKIRTLEELGFNFAGRDKA